ncbi:MAG: histidinol phosphatase, partial [Candidatus Electrothrix sp. AR4]|nr:histidinol phosphatase [Candidatus Electrothrix sp. AR4]
MSEQWKFPGSRWWKIDFHTHTPASDDYGREDTSCKDIAPEKWLERAMLAELDCVVVTDHNSGSWIDKLKKANKTLADQQNRPTWFRKLILFPGVELTVADSSSRIHLLAVFDPSCDNQKVTAVLGACGITSGFGDDKETSTSIGFVESVKKIHTENGIALAAHIDGTPGLLKDVTSLNPELEKSLQAISAAEFCNPHQFDNADPALTKAVDRLAKVGGSDAHKPAEIGKYFSWIKMSNPSIEGLRLALLDHTFCIKKDQLDNPNNLPDNFLSKLTIQSMQHCGRIQNRPFTLL